MAVRTDALTVRYRKADLPAVDALDLEIPGGIIQGLLGPNGAGKSTLLSVLCAVRAPGQGRVEVLGHSLPAEKEALKRRIGLVPQEIALYPTLTVKENLSYLGRMQHIPHSLLKERVPKMIEAFGLAEKSRERVDRLSGGMKRRLNLLAGILHDPELLFLDEPTTGVDVHSRELILEHLKALREKGTTIIYTSHDLPETRELCDRVALMHDGRIIRDGSAEALEAEGLRELLVGLSNGAKV